MYDILVTHVKQKLLVTTITDEVDTTDCLLLKPFNIQTDNILLYKVY